MAAENESKKPGLRELLLEMLVAQQKTVLLLVELRDALADDDDEEGESEGTL